MIRLEFPRTLTFPPAKREYEVGDLLTFSTAWPAGKIGITPGLIYRVKWHQEVPYDLHYIIPENDWKDVDISDPTSYSAAPNTPEMLYPYGTKDTLYQILVGLKPFNGMLHLYMPENQWILALEYTKMYPSNDAMTPGSSDPKRKYIGSIKWYDSPYYDPRLKIVTVYNMLPFYLRFLMDLGDYEKVIAPLIVNHCQLEDVTKDATAEQKAKAQVIRYVTEIAFRQLGMA
ncbi:MAG: hypothetical protein ABSG90_13295 [Dehalococcoidia bacterium]